MIFSVVLSDNGKESFNPVLKLHADADPDHYTKIQSALSWATSNIPCKFQPNPSVTCCAFLLTD